MGKMTLKAAKKMDTNNALVISYLRFSTSEQSFGNSTKRQTDLASEWCERTGHTLTDRLEDKGISAFKGRNLKAGALQAFLQLVEAGTVPPNSILLVEDLDRLSRQRPEVALQLFLSIINAGVSVVTLKDGCEFRAGELDMGRLMMSVMRICLAHEESGKKSFRLAKAWKEKRAEILTGKVFTSLIPAWLKIENEKIVIDEPKAEIVRQIFALALAGHGLGSCTRIANKTWPGIGKAEHFSKSTISKILHNPQVIGLFQPCRLIQDENGKRRETTGDPIKGYYPSIVEEDVFFAVQSGMKSRRTSGGPMGKFVNVFQGIMFHSEDKSAMAITNKDGRRYVSLAAIEGRKGAAAYNAFPMSSLEAAILTSLAEVQVIEIGDASVDGPRRELAGIDGKIDALAKKIAELAAALAVAGNVAAVVQVMAGLERDKGTLTARQQELRGMIAAASENTAADSMKLVMQIVGQSAYGEDADLDRRTRLKNAIRQLVERIECNVSVAGMFRTCSFTVTPRNGKPYRYDATIHAKRKNAISVVNPDFPQDNSRILMETEDDQPPVVTAEAIERIKKMWTDGKGGMAIAKATGTSVSTVYRHKPVGWKARGFGRWHKRTT